MSRDPWGRSSTGVYAPLHGTNVKLHTSSGVCIEGIFHAEHPTRAHSWEIWRKGGAVVFVNPQLVATIEETKHGQQPVREIGTEAVRAHR